MSKYAMNRNRLALIAAPLIAAGVLVGGGAAYAVPDSEGSGGTQSEQGGGAGPGGEQGGGGAGPGGGEQGGGGAGHGRGGDRGGSGNGPGRHHRDHDGQWGGDGQNHRHDKHRPGRGKHGHRPPPEGNRPWDERGDRGQREEFRRRDEQRSGNWGSLEIPGLPS